MNKMEILKNAFEQIGYKTDLWYHEENKIYYLDILGTRDGDGYNYTFCFNPNYEPVQWIDNYHHQGQWLTLEENYKRLEEDYEEQE